MPAKIRIGTNGQPVANSLFRIVAVHDHNRGRDASLDCQIEDATGRLTAYAVVVSNDREGAWQGRGSSLGREDG